MMVSQVGEGYNQDAERPGDKRRLPAKTGDASLDFQEGFLHGVFGIRLRTKKIARQILHARSLPLIESLVAWQVAAEAGRCHGRVLGKFFTDPNGFRFPFERFHSPLPVACHRGEFMLPGQRKSHRSHVFLLGYRRWEEGKGLALAANSKGGVTHLFSTSYSLECAALRFASQVCVKRRLREAGRRAFVPAARTPSPCRAGLW